MTQNVYIPQPTEKKVFEEIRVSPIESVFAWLCIVFGYLFCRAYPASENPLGAFLLVLTLFSVTAIVLKLKGAPFTKLSLFCLISAPVCSAALIISGSQFLTSLAFLYAIVSYLLFIYSSEKNLIESSFSNLLFIDLIKALFILPFCSFGKLFSALSSKNHSRGKVFAKALLGVAITIIPTAIVFSLLSFDEAFLKLFKNIFNFTIDDVFSHLFSLGFAIPLAMYLFGLFTSSQKKLLKENITVSGCYAGFEKVKILPQITAVVATLPIILIYVIFFISQWDYYISAFSGILPESFNYASYAVDGFQELCAVSVINLIIIGAITFFLKRNKNGKNPLLTVFSVVFCVFTLVLVATAISKLALYISAYGLTQRRVLAMWFMIIIALVFIVIALSRFIKRLKALPCAAIVCVLMFAFLSLCNVSGIIAQYNVNAYLRGKHEKIDVEALEELGDSAIPSLVYLVDEMSETGSYKNYKQYSDVKKILNAKAQEFENEPLSLFKANIPALRAQKALEEGGYIKTEQAK